jgi:hypothetical protein
VVVTASLRVNMEMASTTAGMDAASTVVGMDKASMVVLATDMARPRTGRTVTAMAENVLTFFNGGICAGIVDFVLSGDIRGLFRDQALPSPHHMQTGRVVATLQQQIDVDRRKAAVAGRFQPGVNKGQHGHRSRLAARTTVVEPGCRPRLLAACLLFEKGPNSGERSSMFSLALRSGASALRCVS